MRRFDNEDSKQEKDENQSKFSIFDAFEILVPPAQNQTEETNSWLKDVMQNSRQPSSEDLEWINNLLPQQGFDKEIEEILKQNQEIFSNYVKDFNLDSSSTPLQEKFEDQVNEISEIKSIFTGVQNISSSLLNEQTIFDFTAFSKLNNGEKQPGSFGNTRENNREEGSLLNSFIDQFNTNFKECLQGLNTVSSDLAKYKVLFQLAKLTYEKNISQRSVILEELGYSLVEEIGNKKIEGYHACIVKKNKELVICHRGTDPDSLFLNSKYFKQAGALGAELGDINLSCSAIFSDIQILFDTIPDQYYIADYTHRKIVERYPSYKIIHTGHSLGGLLAELLGIKYGQEALSIDAPGSNIIVNQFISSGKIDVSSIEKHKSLITIFKSTPNAINCCGEQIKTPDYLIRFIEKTFEPNILGFCNFTINQHNLDNLITNFENLETLQIWPKGIFQAFVNFLDPIHNRLHWDKYTEEAWNKHQSSIREEISNLTKIEIEAKKEIYKANIIISKLVPVKKELKTVAVTMEDMKFDSFNEGDHLLNNSIEEQTAKIEQIFNYFHNESSVIGETQSPQEDQ